MFDVWCLKLRSLNLSIIISTINYPSKNLSSCFESCSNWYPKENYEISTLQHRTIEKQKNEDFRQNLLNKNSVLLYIISLIFREKMQHLSTHSSFCWSFLPVQRLVFICFRDAAPALCIPIFLSGSLSCTQNRPDLGPSPPVYRFIHFESFFTPHWFSSLIVFCFEES